MRESRTYGSVRGGYRKVSVYSIMEVVCNDNLRYLAGGFQLSGIPR